MVSKTLENLPTNFLISKTLSLSFSRHVLSAQTGKTCRCLIDDLKPLQLIRNKVISLCFIFDIDFLLLACIAWNWAVPLLNFLSHLCDWCLGTILCIPWPAVLCTLRRKWICFFSVSAQSEQTKEKFFISCTKKWKWILWHWFSWKMVVTQMVTESVSNAWQEVFNFSFLCSGKIQD